MIKFGTDGWRAIISDEFTFENVNKVAKAVALYLINHGFSKKPLIIGYDPRFLADKFAEAVAKVMEEAGIDSYLVERDTPTPVVAWEVKDKKAAGAVMLTASHNPAEYCGFKFIPDYAGPAQESITNEIMENSNKDIILQKPKKRGTVKRFDPQYRYTNYIGSFVDPALIRRSKLKIVYDSMHGSGRGYVDKILQGYGCKVEVLHGERDVLFGGNTPEPTDKHLGELKQKVVELSANVGLANDGDADRFGVVDENGNYLHANQVIPLIFDYLVTDKGFSGVVVRSVATTNLVDKIAELHKIKVHETPVGFKHIAKLMLEEEVIIGGEESGGLSIKGHIPEKDGILAGLLVIEMLAKKKRPLSQLWKDLIAKTGEIYTQRVNLELDENSKKALMDKLNDDTPKELSGVKVRKAVKVDGVKLLLTDGSWVLCRPSGTEPIIRIYAESDHREKLAVIVDAVRNLI
ncbi:MAG: phosphoglucomutase/phosphomannomutase family protein [Candidatus Margulisiibacteriota bacterium]|nr:phosphoglucomutase/phosphomannomutase family protein [Candidatus Margulisiibacteriota bacterium]